MKITSLYVSLGLLVLAAGCGGGGGSTGGSSGGGGAPIPVVSPTASASTEPVIAANFVCPTSSTAVSSRATRALRLAGALRSGGRMPAVQASAQRESATALIAVSYDRATVQGTRRSLASAIEMRAGATFRKEVDYPRIGRTMRTLSVPRADLARTIATLRAQPGVRDVGETGMRRYPLAVTAPYYTNDPYFVGFSTTQNNAAPTFQLQPYVENADVPGQWDMHAIHLDDAFAYSQPANGSNVSTTNALGSASVKIAIIDTGADLSQPDLAPKVAFQQCYLSNPDPAVPQSTSGFVTDPDGHGTSVSGLAGAVPNNGFGFTGAGGRTTLYEYRVLPTPDADCFDSKKAPDDPQCGSSSTDIISAIDDAVARGVNVISMSLGGLGPNKTSGCTSGGVDIDPGERVAVANALASNVVVVAAAGNDKNVLDAPGCDAGVIAAGATALADGTPNGAGNSSGSAIAPIEYVASYSSYGSPGAAFRNPNAWGIVAPGGDPKNGSDADNLHWILNLWTSTPSVADDAAYDGCGPDYPGTAGNQPECRELIAGTSMSTPEVAGAAALILAVNPAYRISPAMKRLLCSTADEINDSREGCGRLNVYRAMAVALGDTTPP